MRGIIEPSETGRQSSHTCQAAKISQPDHSITLCRIGLCQDRKANLSGSTNISVNLPDPVNISPLSTCQCLSTFLLCQPAHVCQNVSLVNLPISFNISPLSTCPCLSTFLRCQPLPVCQHFSFINLLWSVNISPCQPVQVYQHFKFLYMSGSINIWNWSTCPGLFTFFLC